MAAPPIQEGAKAAEGEWSTGLMDCCQDCYIFCNGTPLLYGENVRKIDEGGFCSNCMLYYCCFCFACCFAHNTRAAIRRKYNLKAEPCNDCCVHLWCSPCAVCQEAREVRRRTGWVTWQE